MTDQHEATARITRLKQAAEKCLQEAADIALTHGLAVAEQLDLQLRVLRAPPAQQALRKLAMAA